MGALALQPGDVLAGRYRLRRILGTGGMGAIWEAHNEATDRSFAIKILHPTAARDPIIVQRFIQEAKAAGRLRHPSIIEVYDMGTADGVPYMVMELLDGESLEERLRREGKLPVDTALRIAQQCAEALVVAHAADVVHRDLKPANIFLHQPASGRAMVPKILDFGISKLTDPDKDIGLTVSGIILGTPSYMSPEQYRADEHLDGRSDIWSFGVVLCKCLTGQSPFAARRLEEIAFEIVRPEPLELSKLTATLPANVAAIIERCLEKDRASRFASAHELAEACARALVVREAPRKAAHVRPFVVPPAFPEKKPLAPPRSPRLWIGIVAAGLVLVVAGAIAALHSFGAKTSVVEVAEAAAPIAASAPTVSAPPEVAVTIAPVASTEPAPVVVTTAERKAASKPVPPRASSASAKKPPVEIIKQPGF